MTQGQTIRIRDELRFVEFSGKRLAEVTSERDDSIRWTEIRLFRVYDHPSVRYVLQTIGRSVVYHRHDGSCRQGTTLTAAVLKSRIRDDTVPCDACAPPEPEDMPADAVVRAEGDIIKLYRCGSPQQVVDTLRRCAARRLPRRTLFNSSVPPIGQRLLDAAAQEDPEIGAMLSDASPL